MKISRRVSLLDFFEAIDTLAGLEPDEVVDAPVQPTTNEAEDIILARMESELSVGDAVDLMRAIARLGRRDPEAGHSLADGLMRKLLTQLGYGAVVSADCGYPHWCA